MQKIFFSAGILLSALFVSCSQKPGNADCVKFRNGDFFIKSKNNIPSYSIHRKDSLQYEKNDETGSIRIFNVKWNTPCSYELRLLHKPADSATLHQSALRDSFEKITSTIEILETAKTYYVFKIKKEGFNMTYTDTIWVSKSIGSVFSIGEIYQ